MAKSFRLSQPLILLLEMLMGSSAWTYGYEVSRVTGIQPGTLYPLLIRLSDAGWLSSRWEDRVEGGSPPRHLYRLTAEGKRAGRECLARAVSQGWSSGPVGSLT